MNKLRYVSVLWCPIHIVLCFFVFIRLVCHIWPVSLDWSFVIAPSVFSDVYLRMMDTLYIYINLHYSQIMLDLFIPWVYLLPI